jgi:hypothetical protein
MRLASAAALVGATIVLGASPAWGHHRFPAVYEGTNAQGGRVQFKVGSIDGSPVGVFDFYPGAAKATTDLGQDCVPSYPPPAARPDYLTPIVDHAFSSTTPPVLISGSFDQLSGAQGTFRITSDVWSPPPGELPSGSLCDTGTVSWTATCLGVTPRCSTPPVFSGSAAGATVSDRGRVTIPLRIGCPAPGVDCKVSVAASARADVNAAARRRRVKIGRSDYLIKARRSANTRVKLNVKGRRLLRRLGRMHAKVKISVDRGGSVTRKTVTARLKAPSA